MKIPSISIDIVAAARRSGSMLSGADEQTIRTAELRYRKFLKLAAKYPDVERSPARDIDEVWHLHMLHPRAYAEDCNRIFGTILDHDGGFGKDSEQQYQELLGVFDQTAVLWNSEYSESYVTDNKAEVVRCIKACRVACKV
ncbi:MAG TPA: glycine-rich domain-containing protein-like [Thiobacillaceae bacterium]|nr:glycine-rich domain-containing protein-like [Thiobacillaceae bacterium]